MVIDSDIAHSFTRWLMVAGFVPAMFFCAKSKNRGLALFYLVAVVETFTRFRYPLHGWMRDLLLPSLKNHMGKHEVQTTFILILTIAAACAILWLSINIRRYTWPRIMMLAGTWGTLCMCAIEMISPHRIDAFIYDIDGVFLRSGLIYFALSLATTIGAICFLKQTSHRGKFDSDA